MFWKYLRDRTTYIRLFFLYGKEISMEKKYIVVVTSLIENEEGEILLSQRNDPKFLDAHKKRDLPWGKNDFWESPEETIVREIKEETWLDVQIQEMIPTCVFNFRETEVVHQHTLVLCYKTKKIWWVLGTTDPKILDLKWVKKEEIRSYDLLRWVEQFLSFL